MEDRLYDLLNIFNRLPKRIQNIIGIIYYYIPVRIKYGPFYKKYLSRVKSFSGATNEETLNKQKEILFEQVNYAIREIPYYRNFKEINSLEQFLKIPVINKQIIREHFNEFVSSANENKKHITNTGGSSGTPLIFYLEKNVSRPKEKAHFDWFWGNFNYKSTCKTLMVRGMPLRNNKTYEHRSLDNHLNVSCYNINEKNIPLVLNAMNKYKPDIIHAYPSSLKILTALLEPYHNRLETKIQTIFLGSELLPDHDRCYFENFYQSKAVSWYGHTERLIHGGNCNFQNGFHFFPFYGYIELLDDEDNVVTKPDTEGRIVATGFDNKVMPFIRYDTGDTGILSEEKECACGFKGLTLKRITGRKQDSITLSDGTKVSLTAFIFGQHLKEFEKIREIQVCQPTEGKVEIRIVKKENFTTDDEKSLIETLMQSINNKIEIKVTYVERITKTSRGKNNFFVTS